MRGGDTIRTHGSRALLQGKPGPSSLLTNTTPAASRRAERAAAGGMMTATKCQDFQQARRGPSSLLATSTHAASQRAASPSAGEITMTTKPRSPPPSPSPASTSPPPAFTARERTTSRAPLDGPAGPEPSRCWGAASQHAPSDKKERYPTARSALQARTGPSSLRQTAPVVPKAATKTSPAASTARPARRAPLATPRARLLPRSASPARQVPLLLLTGVRSACHAPKGALRTAMGGMCCTFVFCLRLKNVCAFCLRISLLPFLSSKPNRTHLIHNTHSYMHTLTICFPPHLYLTPQQQHAVQGLSDPYLC